MAACPFCNPEASRIFHAGQRVLGIWDAYPVSEGHALIVTKRHIASWFEATGDERSELIAALSIARERVEDRHQPDGFNVGINIGEAAGQTIPHLHVHLIPRQRGDVANPRGGVRYVIPERGDYDPPREERPQPQAARPYDGFRQSHLTTGQDRPLLKPLLADLNNPDTHQADFAIAFVLESGVKRMLPHLREFIDRGGRLRFLTGDYQHLTQPRGLRLLRDLQDDAVEQQGSVELRAFECKGESFHPKAYILQGAETAVAWIGSSNLSEAALGGGGVEWNTRCHSRSDPAVMDEIRAAFEKLFSDPHTQPLTDEWIREYEKRRWAPPPRLPQIRPPAIPEREAEPPPPPPTPHEVQEEALRALEKTRDEGNRLGLVVLATGLGKTYLAAFDSHRPEFARVLFVAHREEILRQARDAFRAVRPEATFGVFSGTERLPDADLVFASVQTLGRTTHLNGFEPEAFDYVVIDEFHHAEAKTYRRILDHFSPKFLLGLTATPHRMDGADLLALCGENLVYQCDMFEAIRRDLLAPFHYFGVPDLVDYEQIPWRNRRFDPAELDAAVATKARADNALGQLRQHGVEGSRTLAFCCSTRHADFMREHFRNASLRVAAVHSEVATSDARVESLERLEAGALDVVFAVDMFNEGVDVPSIDSVLMLRPTESRTLWLQQFGRGLRKAEGKDRLTVIDYIGNHRSFLNKPGFLLQAERPGDAYLGQRLDATEKGDLDLPPGCEVTYELEAVNIMRGLLRPAAPDAIRLYYEQQRDLNGERLTASEIWHDGYNPRSAGKDIGGWLEFVRLMGHLSPEEQQVLDDHRAGKFLRELEKTPMTKSYKMLTLLAMLNADSFPGKLALDQLAEGVTRIAQRSAPLASDLGVDLANLGEVAKKLRDNPVKFWAEARGMGGGAFFETEGECFATTFSIEDDKREALQGLTREIADWRLAEYLSRTSVAPSPDHVATCKVSHAQNQPHLFLHRDKNPDLPMGLTPVEIDGEILEAKFVKVALNVITGAGDPSNRLPDILRRWFGPSAGRPGTRHFVRFSRSNGRWCMEPGVRSAGAGKFEVGKSYPRQEIPKVLGKSYSMRWNQGYLFEEGQIFLLVTLDKSGFAQAHQYADRFLSADRLEWFSQNRTKQGGKDGERLSRHAEMGIPVHLFVRPASKTDGKTTPFTYCGELEFEAWEGEKPIQIRWRLVAPLDGPTLLAFSKRAAWGRA